MNIEADALLESISGASPSERYIILINNNLQEQNQEHLLTIKKMEINLDELYQSLFKSKSQVENLNGLLTDLHETNANLCEITQKNSTELRNYKIKAKTHLRYLQIIMIIFASFYYEFYGFNTFAPVAMMLMVIAAFQESTLDGIANI